ncbi:Fic family protein [Photorhabdus tasmaniensis]
MSEVLDSLLAKTQVISDPFEQSFFIMVHLPYLQPFADINKRTSRLAANLPLLRSNLCPLTFWMYQKRHIAVQCSVFMK